MIVYSSNILVFNKSFVGYWSDYSVDVTRLSIFMQLNVTTKCWSLDIYAVQGWLNAILMEEAIGKNIDELWYMKTNNVGSVPRRLMVMPIKNLRFRVILFVVIASAQAIEITKFST